MSYTVKTLIEELSKVSLDTEIQCIALYSDGADIFSIKECYGNKGDKQVFVRIEIVEPPV